MGSLEPVPDTCTVLILLNNNWLVTHFQVPFRAPNLRHVIFTSYWPGLPNIGQVLYICAQPIIGHLILMSSIGARAPGISNKYQNSTCVRDWFQRPHVDSIYEVIIYQLLAGFT